MNEWIERQPVRDLVVDIMPCVHAARQQLYYCTVPVPV